MRRILLILILLHYGIFSFTQTYSLHIDSLITKVNIDTLSKYVKDLSGESEVIVNGETIRITHRIDEYGNESAGDYIKETLQKTGLSIEEQFFTSDCRSIIAYQFGSEYPEEYYIICAHYDAIPNYAADDNASGTAAVLEAARILSHYEFPYSIIYALWDQEETGLNGSYYFSGLAHQDNMTIKGVLNLDMIGYNITQNNRFDIHVQPYGNSVQLGSYIYNMSSVYNLSLGPVLFNPGSSSSDHRAFWDYGYSALMIIEPSTGSLFNPYYHTDQDRIDKFNMTFFHEMSKLALGSIAGLANGDQFTSVDEGELSTFFTLKIIPNPIIANAYIELSLFETSYVRMEMFTLNGKRIHLLYDHNMEAGQYKYDLNKLNLASGIYLLKLSTNWGMLTEKLIIL